MFMLRYAKKVFSLILTTAFFLNFNVVSYATNKPELNKDDNGLIIEMAQNIAPQNEENNIEKSVHGNNVKPINVEEINNQNFEQLADFVSFRTIKSDDQDGGNALFAALEYWNGGFVYNAKRNGVAMLKKFQQKRHGVSVDGE